MHGEITVSFDCRDQDAYDAIHDAIKAVVECVANDVTITQRVEV